MFHQSLHDGIEYLLRSIREELIRYFVQVDFRVCIHLEIKKQILVKSFAQLVD